jgi:hypothetical protein
MSPVKWRRANNDARFFDHVQDGVINVGSRSVTTTTTGNNGRYGEARSADVPKPCRRSRRRYVATCEAILATRLPFGVAKRRRPG